MFWIAVSLLVLTTSVISGEVQDVASNTTMHPGEIAITVKALQEHKINQLLSLTTLLRTGATTVEPETLPTSRPLSNVAVSVPLEQVSATVMPSQAGHKMVARQLGYPNMGTLNACFAGAGSAVNNLRIPNPIALGNQQMPFDYYG